MFDTNGLSYLASEDPWVVAGLLLIGASGLLSFRLYQKVRALGDHSYAQSPLRYFFMFTIPRAYLELARARRWSKLPAYAVWLCAAAGVALLVFGLFKL
jgi:hypothetical protein